MKSTKTLILSVLIFLATEPATASQEDTQDGGVEVNSEDLEGIDKNKLFFIQTKLSKTKAVIGEHLVMTLYLYSSINFAALDIVVAPGTEGFWVENLLDRNNEFRSEPVMVDGRKYNRTALKKVALFPIKPGRLSITPALVEIHTGRGGHLSWSRSFKRTSLLMNVQVEKLPVKGQPRGFDPANVGSYFFNGSIDDDSVRVGEPITLTLTAVGEGNIKNLVLPTLTGAEGFKVYAPDSETDMMGDSESVKGTKTNRILIIPTKPGNHTIAEIEWSFYNPNSRRYEVLNSKKHMITVSKAKNTTRKSAEPYDTQFTSLQSQDSLNRRLKSILSKGNFNKNGSSPVLTKPWFITLALVLPLFYLGVVSISRTRRRLAEDGDKNKPKRAFSIAKEELTSLGSSVNRISSWEFYGRLAQIVGSFLDNRFEVLIAGDTRDDLRKRLLETGHNEALVKKVILELEACDFARFGKNGGIPAQKEKSLKRMESLIENLAAPIV